MRTPAAVAASLLALLPAACGGGDDRDATATPTPSAAPQGDAAPPGTSSLPPQFVRCMAERGYEIRSPAEIHAAPQEVLQACFGSLHQNSP